MPPRKRLRTSTPRRAAAATVPSPTPALPANLLLEIAARSDARTIFRCAATCKLLRRAALSPDFLRRVSRGPCAAVPSTFLCVLGDTSFVHPLTLAAWDFWMCHLAPFVSRSAAGLFEQYRPLTSRRGLVVLGRREINRWRRSERRSDLCVYDPMTNGRTFFPVPPDIGRDPYHGLLGYVTVVTSYVVLTAADGVAA